jgi:EAL domain-containing protein (putative c-di-GMP-specific phosphodiesterase class I)
VNPALKALTPYFQKQFNAQKEVVGAEILMRPQFGNIIDIVKILEMQNQIYHLDLLAFSYALKFQEINSSSNFSGKSLSNKKVIDSIILADPMVQVKIEITESKDLSTGAVKNIEFLSQFGFKISLDDYGTQFNSLNRLVTLPVSEIKIDKYLIDYLPKTKAIAIIKNTINLAHEINCMVVAEGIESKEQFDILVDLGCDRFQGFWLHKPEYVIGYRL